MDALESHLAGLRTQARFARQACVKAADVFERTLARNPSPTDIDQARSQARAAMRALRLTNQLLAQAAELMEHPAEGGSDDRDRSARTRVG